MRSATTQSSARAWALAEWQEGVVAYEQLRSLGFSARAIRHRVAKGRLHARYRGVYAVGRRQLTRKGELMAAVLRCGPGATLSHDTAAELSEIRPRRAGPIEVSVPPLATRGPTAFERIAGLRSHPRTSPTPGPFRSRALFAPSSTLRPGCLRGSSRPP